MHPEDLLGSFHQLSGGIDLFYVFRMVSAVQGHEEYAYNLILFKEIKRFYKYRGASWDAFLSAEYGGKRHLFHAVWLYPAGIISRRGKSGIIPFS